MKRLPLFFWGLLIISVIVYITLRDLRIGFIFAHLGGFSIVGLFACLAGTMARKKQHNYWTAFLSGIFIPIMAGLLGVFILFPPNPTLACGGSVVLIAALLVVVYYSTLKRKAAIIIS